MSDIVERLRTVDISYSETGEWCAEAADKIERLRKTLNDHLESEAAETMRADRLRAERDSKNMFVARLENMVKNGDCWLTIPAVLALLNDCDMLASRNPIDAARKGEA